MYALKPNFFEYDKLTEYTRLELDVFSSCIC